MTESEFLTFLTEFFYEKGTSLMNRVSMKKNKVFIVRCTEDEKKIIKDLAKNKEFSVSRLVRWLVRQEYERKKQDER